MILEKTLPLCEDLTTAGEEQITGEQLPARSMTIVGGWRLPVAGLPEHHAT
jgi:hypothetical protein